MAKDGDGGAIGILLLFVCCIFSCIIGLLVWANGGPEALGLTKEQIENALKGVTFTKAVPPNIVLGTWKGLGSYNYNRILNASTIEPSNSGGVLTGKTQDQCDSLCHSTDNCYGYTIDGDKCQLKNNVTLVKFDPGVSNLYASQDVGGILYEHFPYKKLNMGEPRLWTFNGSFADAVSNCHAHTETCKGFTWNGTNSADMYAAVTAVDGSAPGNHTYTTREAIPTFILFPNQSYSDSADDTKTTNPNWAREDPFNPTSDSDYFKVWRSGWDAGTDSYGDSSRTANTITTRDLAHCQNACVANTWCGSFVVNSAGTECYMRHGASPKQYPINCHGTPYTPGPGASCTCGATTAGGAICNGFDPAREGDVNGGKTTYVKKQPPLGHFCAQECKNDQECKVATYKPSSGECKIYHRIPTNKKTNDQTSNTVWMVDYFPGQ